ncbi:MAG: PEP-CTERM sorting domain-containing protein [Verrucomicrobiia bacterium]
MKICKRSFARSVRLYAGVLIVISSAVLAIQSEATIYTVNSTINGNTYSASYNNSVNGFSAWSENGANQLGLQSLYYSMNGGPVTPLTGAIVNTGSSGFTSQYITATFAIPNGNIADTLTINGNTLSESIQFDNLGSSGLDISIFQYSDFVLGGSGAAGSQTVTMTPASGGGYATANQTGGGLALTWNGDVPSGTTLVQANSSGAPFGPFIGLGSNLDNATLAAINTYAVFGYEFSGSVLAGNLLTISENATYPSPVPEPSSMALISSGMFILALISRRRGN